MKNVELVFIPSPGLSHLVSTVEMAKLLLDRDQRLSITFLIMKFPNDNTVDDFIQKTSSSNPTDTAPRLKFTNLPSSQEDSTTLLFDRIDKQAANIRDFISDLIKRPSPVLAGLVLDMFCTKFIEIADEFSLPSYVFFTSGACSLGLFNHLISLKFEHGQDIKQYKDSDANLSVPCFSNPVPVKVMPAVLLEESPMSQAFFSYFRRLAEMKGIMVNTFHELESYAIEALLSDGKTPKVYPVGPILNSGGQTSNSQSIDDGVKKWLDEQPENSVVFLCFGTMGSFDEAQVREIALALERSGTRFLWSLRKPGAKGPLPFPTEYEDFREVLPDGFLERTEGVGRVIGWAPQVAVLSHVAVGGFVSHCGWNSVLESVWFGVPVVAFPLYAEQQLNAFELVKELGMAEVIRMDYRMDFKGVNPPEIVGAEEIEAAIRRLMDEGGSGVREKVKEMQSKSRAALMDSGGSSYNAQSLFIEDVIKNVS